MPTSGQFAAAPNPEPGDGVSWKLLRSEQLLVRPPWLTVYQDAVQLPGGRILEDFYRVVLLDYAVVAALTPDSQFVLGRSYKHGLGRVSLTAPAGHIEPEESPLAAAQRELLEETGYSAPEWHFLGSFLTDGNRQCGTGYFFLAHGALRTALPRADDAEQLHLELVSPDRVVAALRSGDVALMPTATVLGLALAHLADMKE